MQVKQLFLQHVIIECNNGDLFSDHVPILIKLRDYVRKARRDENFNLKLHICSYLKDVSQQEVETLLDEGRVLLLLDGLDEVPEANMDRVIDEIDYLIEDHPLIRLIITCRLQGNKYKFNKFFYVEIADFREPQIIAFAENWFAATYNNNCEKGKAKAQKFMSQLKLSENKQILELVTTPLLLSLVCKIFSVKHQFYSQRHKLYEEGLEILLSKWDESRRIKRDRLYQDLNVEDKVKLLSYIAARKFEQEQYVLFEKSEIQGYISEYLDISDEDSQAVLESIIQQHGLLIPRAQLIYSFSHLTFQEYFASKWFVDNSAWEDLATHVTQEYWREIFLLTNSISLQKEEFLLALKISIDKLVSETEKIQQVLEWINKKSINEKSVLDFRIDSFFQIRAYYFDLLFAYEVKNGFTLNPKVLVELDLFKDIYPENNYPRYNNFLLDRTLWWICTYIRDSARIHFAFGYQFEIGNALQIATEKSKILFQSKIIPLIFYEKLLNLWQNLPDLDNESKDIFINWWKENGENWLQQLRQLMIEYRDIGHDWQFTEEEKTIFKEYYYANQLLIECLNVNYSEKDCFWQEITESVFLPIAEIEKRKQSNN